MLYSGAGTDTPPPSLKRDIDLLVGLVNMASVNGRITEHRGYHEAIQLNMDFLQDSDTKQFLHTFYNSVGTALSTSLTPILESIEP